MSLLTHQPASINEYPKIAEIIKKIKTSTHNDISFCDIQKSYCIGIVDMVSSTKITAHLEHGKMCDYYKIYLNSMTEIVKEFGAVVTKNVGDSLLYYFPDTHDAESEDSLRVALECSLALIDSRQYVNNLLDECGLPQVSYRISSDYGRLSIAKSSHSTREDVFGPTVNLCSKINCMAMPNTIVVGGDLYQIARSLKCYRFHSLVGFQTGVRLDYPVYSICRQN
ncbi:MAG: adenylate/guanylate cyclase domain-containing protein [Thaumarchaeota archaeon]|nr:adenylate/guanylate cyclase domain-containing protein [Nitrososphaerota archaeon]